MAFADNNMNNSLNYLNLNWKTNSSTLTGPTGSTSVNYDFQNNLVTTTFDTNSYSNGTDLSWLRTILHEAAHAYVISISNLPNLTTSERQELLGDNWLIAYSNQGHDYIVDTYISSIADILQEYGNYQNYNLTRQFYEDLAWGGLQNTTAFGNLSTSTKERILDNIAIELTGQDTNGNNKTQKGTDAGC